MGKIAKYTRFAIGALALALWIPPGFLLILGGKRGLAMKVFCRTGLWALSATLRVYGPLPGMGTLVAANHTSYVDIFALGAVAPGAFLAKSEIEGWPLIGWLSRIAGVIFVTRGRGHSSARSLPKVRERIHEGERILLFPEGGIIGKTGEVTRFHSMFFDEDSIGGCPVIPAAIRYLWPKDVAAWLWVEGETPFTHLWSNLLPAEPITIVLNFGEPVMHGVERTRREVADAAQRAVEKLWIEAENKA